MVGLAEWIASLIFLLYVGAGLLEMFEAVFWGGGGSYRVETPKIITCHYCGKNLRGATRCPSCNAFYRK